MFRRGLHQQRSMFTLAGWLFADLFLVLTMLFFTSATPWVSASTPPQPQICGIDQKISPVLITVPDPSGLRQQRSSAIKSFNNVVKQKLRSSASKTAGFVEVFGGNPYNNPADGVKFAAGAIKALKQLATQHFIFTAQTLYFDPQWSGNLLTNQVKVYISFFLISTSCQPQE